MSYARLRVVCAIAVLAVGFSLRSVPFFDKQKRAEKIWRDIRTIDTATAGFVQQAGNKPEDRFGLVR